ncbi:hypothetical protein MHBO_000614 [Bonamia ostreae]|uniref:Uncharacterized protein n=1 Tax=Bonamia ostreae TaxID=126728 RepID=A0ABV2AGE9_9EUKA
MSDPLNPNTEVPVYHPVLNDILFETKDNVDLTYNVNHGLIEMCSNPMKVQAKLNDLMAGWADSDSEKKKCSLLQNIWNILSKSILKNKALKCLFEGSYGTIKRCSENENNILELRPALDQMAINSSMYGMRFYDVYLSDSKEYARIPTVILVIITNTLEYSISKVAKHNLTDTYTSGELLHKLKASVKDCNANVNPANKETMEIYKKDVKDIDKAKSIQELENWAKNLINKVSDIAASNEPKTLFRFYYLNMYCSNPLML